jgi:hypothetical protein
MVPVLRSFRILRARHRFAEPRPVRITQVYRETPGLTVLLFSTGMKDRKIGTLAAGHASRRLLSRLSLGVRSGLHGAAVSGKDNACASAMI